MHDRWLIAYESTDTIQKKYHLARHACGDIAVFDSKRSAERWAYWFKANKEAHNNGCDVVFIRIPSQKP